jgi:magnesium transporter
VSSEGGIIINCAAYKDGKKLADISQEEISTYVERGDCLVWVALRDADGAELALMQEEFGLHELAVEDARHGHQRPKIEEYGNSLFTALHTVEVADGDLRVGEVAIFAGPNYVLSVRNGSQRGFADVRTRCEREPDLLRHGAGYVLYALLDAVVDRYFPVLDWLESELEALEERLFAGGPQRESIQSLYALKQKFMTLKHAVAPLLDAVGKLYGGRIPPICAGMQDYFRDVYDHLVRLNQIIDGDREMLITAMSVNLSVLQIHENEVTKRLASYAALIAVPTMIAGIYGMNFQHMPELRSPWGYPASLAVMAVIDGYIFYRLRRARWL